ncbi:NADPH:quinone oxidoreductase family protein [Hydrogenophaga sp.]|uniref:NADPH:quinone oxidoreductase family protein n=1 Tax=Hydrogenophaga sp. TaxID=1904254 RepID=UPI002729234C|nr:NADPH:quinone oxidoreductase family protein [Hydrogenophaga sp.]MDO9435523.1 NADPH:quinone oxidoreductase family protein [Hydrogenophaga sp.]
MKAVLIREFGPVETLKIEEVADPVVAPGQVLIDVQATAANFVDLLVVAGTYQFLPERPFVPGKLPTGIVRAVGEGVTHVKVGDRVLTLAEQGGYAQKALAKAADCFRIPDNMPFVEAASMALAYDTAWFALCERGRAKAGETVLVLGATGAVGLAAVQLAKAYGLKVIAGVSSPAKADAVTAAGADAWIDLSKDNLRDSIREQVHALTDGKGADIVLDPLGGDIFDGAVRALAWCGRMVIIGFAAGRIPTLKMNYVLVKNIEVSGIQVSDYRKRTPDKMAHCMAEIFRLYAEGKLVASPTRTFPLESVQEALAALQGRKAAARLVLLPHGDPSGR